MDLSSPKSTSESESESDDQSDLANFLNDIHNMHISPSKNARDITRKMMIPIECVGLVRGNSGSKIEDIAVKTRTDIESPLSKHDDPIFKITGTKQDIDKAYQIIWHIVKSKFINGKVNANKQQAVGRVFDDSFLDDDDFLVKKKPVQRAFIGWVIGKGGENVQQIEDETKTEIKSPQEGANPEFLIAGRKRGVCQAMKRIDKSIELAAPRPPSLSRGESSWSIPEGICEEIFEVPESVMSHVIGKKGSTVKKIMQDTGTKIKSLPGFPEFKICGSEPAIQQAKMEIRRIVELYCPTARATSSSNLSRDSTEKTPPPSRAEDEPETPDPTQKKLSKQDENVRFPLVTARFFGLLPVEAAVVKKEARVVPSSEDNTSSRVAEKNNANNGETEEPCKADVQVLLYVPDATTLQPLLGKIADKTKTNVKAVTRHNRQAIQIEGGSKEVKVAWERVEKLMEDYL